MPRGWICLTCKHGNYYTIYRCFIHAGLQLIKVHSWLKCQQIHLCSANSVMQLFLEKENVRGLSFSFFVTSSSISKNSRYRITYKNKKGNINIPSALKKNSVFSPCNFVIQVQYKT